MAEYMLDWIESLTKAWLLLYLCKDCIILKERYRSTGRVLFFLQSLLINYWISHSAWVDQILYGNTSGVISNSSYSIIKLIIVFCSCYLAMDLLYQGRRLAKLYLLLVFYTVQEMIRFAWHSIWSLSITWYIDSLTEKVLAKNIEPEQFYIMTEHVQFYSYLLFAAGSLSFMYITLKLYRRYLTEPVNELSREGVWFLMLTPIISMVFDVLWRISFFYQNGTEMEFMYEKHGSMYVVVPAIAVLCLACTVFSRKIYSELMHSEEQKNNLLFYRQQLLDMTAHVRELEQLYDGIRGMRHDINNYVADIEQLLSMSAKQGHMTEPVRVEAEQYLCNMQQAANKLTLQFCTGNPVTDVILNRKGQICSQENILLSGDLIYPAGFGIEAFDLGILLNNALDNAIEACRKISANKKKEIDLRGYAKGRMFFLVIKNTCNETLLRMEGNRLRTTKTDEWHHGLGMNNMRSCVEKYYGTIQYEMLENYFSLTIMLQGISR